MNTCTHRLNAGKTGLCPSCRRDRDEDPEGWYHFGHHPEGEANWRRLRDEIAAERKRISRSEEQSMNIEQLKRPPTAAEVAQLIRDCNE